MNRQKLVNVLIVVAAVVLFGGFLALALPGEDNNSDELDAIAQQTTTTERRVTTTRPTTTTSTTLLLAVPTTLSPATTAAPRTPTTRRPTTATTRAPSPATTAPPGPTGQVNEQSDNTMTFAHNVDGSCSGSPTEPPAGTAPFRFVLSTTGCTASGDSAAVTFVVTLENKTSRTLTFPGGLKIAVTIKTPGGADIGFTIVPEATPGTPPVNDIRAGETIRISQQRTISGFGTFEVRAACDVNYG